MEPNFDFYERPIKISHRNADGTLLKIYRYLSQKSFRPILQSKNKSSEYIKKRNPISKFNGNPLPDQ